MSTEIEVEIVEPGAAPMTARGEPLLVRTFEAHVSEDGDGRTIEGKIIPYNVRTMVADPPDFTPYEEEMMHGVFRESVKAPNRVILDFEHYGAQNDLMGSLGSLQGAVGRGARLWEEEDGLYGQFRVFKHSDGDKALEMVNEDVIGFLSAAFKPLRSLRTSGNVMQRVKAHLDRVSLCRTPAYADAKILAVRTDATSFAIEPVTPFDPELAAKLERLGFAVPEELKTRQV